MRRSSRTPGCAARTLLRLRPSMIPRAGPTKWRRGSALLPTLARAGVARIYSLGMGSSTLPPDARRQARAFSSLPREVRADRDEFAKLSTVLRQTQALKSLDGKPLFVLTADLG